MAHYVLVNNATGDIIYRINFGGGSITKDPQPGTRWVLDEPPAFEAWQQCARVLPIPAGATEVEYTITDRDLARLKREKQVQITAKRDQLTTQGVEVTVAGDTFPVDTRNPLDLVKINGVVSGAIIAKMAGAEQQFFFTDANNVDHLFSTDDALSFGVQVLQALTQYQAASRTHKQAVDALTTAQEVYEYDFSGGW